MSRGLGDVYKRQELALEIIDFIKEYTDYAEKLGNDSTYLS